MGSKVACYPGAIGCSDGQAALGEPDPVCYGLGHSTCQGGTMPLNPFGQAFKAAGFEWTRELCQADSDGDGETNGQELGDPCCEWSRGEAESKYMESFHPSHPGDAASRQGRSYVLPGCGEETTEGGWGTEMGVFAPGEEQRYVDLRIKNYTLPPVMTDYVDFVFNFHDDDHPVYHIAFGEAIVDQPLHLHHFVVTGCSEHIADELEGRPLRRSEVPSSCNLPVGGFAGWAPGGILWDSPVFAGIAIGPGVGIVGFMVEAHFTDGDLNPGAVSQDGLRIHYTPHLRNFTTDATTPLFVSGNPSMVIPPGSKRWFITRTCEVARLCEDLDNVTAREMFNGYSCPTLGWACDDYEIVRSYCPVTCGAVACTALSEEGELPISTVNFHGHLLATEMYQTLTREGVTIDVGSASPWHFGDQVTFPLLTRNLSVRVGDVLQSTCVYNSQSRKENTPMGPSTVDEMCIISLATLRHTHADMPMSAFHCKGDAWSGELAHGENALQIAHLHPVSKARTVWRPTRDGQVFSMPELPVRLCPERSEAWPASCLSGGDPDGNCCALKDQASCAPGAETEPGLELELVWGDVCFHSQAVTAYAYMCCTLADPSPTPTPAPSPAPTSTQVGEPSPAPTSTQGFEPEAAERHNSASVAPCPAARLAALVLLLPVLNRQAAR